MIDEAKSSDNIPASTRTFSEILSDLQRSKVSIKDWSLTDLTIGLYLIYLSQASAKDAQAFKGLHISCNNKASPPSLLFPITISQFIILLDFCNSHFS